MKLRIPEKSFFLFGAGNRRKFLYKQGKLIPLHSSGIIAEWEVTGESIMADQYTVLVRTKQNNQIRIYEEEKGVFLQENDKTTCLCRTPVNLPSFEGRPYQSHLRILHHEMVIRNF